MAFTKVRRALVVVLDVCSSAEILEALTTKKEDERFWDSLREIKRQLGVIGESLPFEPYKFTGDGWILLFPPSTNGIALLQALRTLCEFYKTHYDEKLAHLLDHSPPRLGLTFGIDVGKLVHQVYFGKGEYIGLPLIVATRLQSAIGARDTQPGNKALISKAAFKEHFQGAEKLFRVRVVPRTLKKVSGSPSVNCWKVLLLKKPPKTTSNKSQK